jgi:flagellar hook protein FlgE
VDGEERVFLTDVKGNFLLGYNADTATGDLTVDLSGVGALSPIDVTRSTALSVANATTTLAVLGNLAPDTAVGANETFSFTVLDGTGDADELADERLVTLDFTKTGNNAWDMTISAENGTVSAPAVQPVPVTFDANGQLVSLNGSTTPTQDFTVDWTGPVVSTPINLGLAGFTQVSAPSAISRVNVNGNSDGFLREVAFGQNGQVIGSFSNGIARPIGQVALGDVVAPERMAVLNGNHYRITQNSGELALYDFTDTTRATFQPGALERSTTNLTQEFTNLIVTQRAYSSAATTIRTVDEMMQTATNLKN